MCHECVPPYIQRFYIFTTETENWGFVQVWIREFPHLKTCNTCLLSDMYRQTYMCPRTSADTCQTIDMCDMFNMCFQMRKLSITNLPSIFKVLRLIVKKIHIFSDRLSPVAFPNLCLIKIYFTFYGKRVTKTAVDWL